MNNKNQDLKKLQTEIENLQIGKQALKIELQLQKERVELKQAIRDNGGDNIFNFKQDVYLVLGKIWECITFLFENISVGLGKIFDFFERIEQEEISRANKKR